MVIQIFNFNILRNTRKQKMKRKQFYRKILRILESLIIRDHSITTPLYNKRIDKKETLNRIINQLCHIKWIDFYASDLNFPRVQSCCLKLNNLGIHAQAFNTFNGYYISNLNTEDCVSFIVSHTGKNPTMLEIAYELRKKNLHTVAITSKIDKDLELVCNESLYLYSSEKHSLGAFNMVCHLITFWIQFISVS